MLQKIQKTTVAKSTRKIKALEALGIPPAFLYHTRFLTLKEIADFVTPYTHIRQNAKGEAEEILVTKKSQIAQVNKCVENAHFDLMVISSNRNLTFASMATIAIVERLLPKLPNAHWHIIYDGFKDALINAEYIFEEPPSLLILTNVTQGATPLKVEKLRDLTTMYACPKIIVTAGHTPLQMCDGTLYKAAQAGLYLAG